MRFPFSLPPLSELGLSLLPGPPVLPGSGTEHGKTVSLTCFIADSISSCLHSQPSPLLAKTTAPSSSAVCPQSGIKSRDIRTGHTDFQQ